MALAGWLLVGWGTTTTTRCKRKHIGMVYYCNYFFALFADTGLYSTVQCSTTVTAPLLAVLFLQYVPSSLVLCSHCCCQTFFLPINWTFTAQWR